MAKLYVFSGEELEKIGVETIGDGRVKCRNCNWGTSQLFVLADSREQAIDFIRSGDAGFCGECMAELIAEWGYKIQ